MLAGKKKDDELDTYRLLIVTNYSDICRVLHKLLAVAYDVFALIRRIISRSWFRICTNSFFFDSKAN